MTNEHSPDEYRINGVVANMPDFGRAFSCKPGQPMMRANACRVWGAVGRAFTLCPPRNNPTAAQF